MPIEWDDSLETGIPIIDEQHRELFFMLNRIGRLRLGEESFIETYNEIENYACNHFKTEEDYMISIKYPEYNIHKASHDQFVKDFKIFQEKIDENIDRQNLGLELSDFVCDWIINHYTGEDVKFVEYIKKSL